MKSRRNIFNDLKYTKEHFVCENYISDERSILEPIEVKGGEYLIREEVERFTLGFILSGEMDISTAGSVCQRVGEKQMFLIAAGDNFHGFPSGDTLSEQRGYHPLIGHGNHTDIQRGQVDSCHPYVTMPHRLADYRITCPALSGKRGPSMAGHVRC